ncbi:MAG: UDPGP type 1 family protein [Lachnospiraceae bacterium]|nr:UDPGP type 1 family protein [Lachnospiraceae bacterium]
MQITQVKTLLEKYNQEHLLKYYEELSEGEKAGLLDQIADIDFSVLELIKDKDIEQKRGHIEPIEVCTIEEIEAHKERFFEMGMDAIKAGKVGAVLLAGGQGTRLGADKPKGIYNIGIEKPLYIFEMIMKNLMDVVSLAGVYIPLFVMTSEKNHEDTVAFFEEKNYFGYDRAYVHFFKQAMAVATDYEGKIYLEDKGKVATSPNGNGGWFTSFMKAGLLEPARKQGMQWLNVFAVDNVLQKIADPYFVGAVIDSGMVSGAKVVAKAEPKEKVGAICLEDGKPSIVEYYELSDEMAYQKTETGRLAYNYGVILNYLFDIDTLERITKESMQLHVVEKKIPYINDEGVIIKPEEVNGYKFELLVLDMVHMMDNCLPYEVERNKEFAPIKNKTGIDSVESARELLRLNGIEVV